MGNRKVALIGGGGVRTPLVIYGVNECRQSLGVDEMVLYDPDPARAELMCRLGAAVVAQQGGRLRVRVAPSAEDAIAGATFILTAIRSGGMQGRASDEHICTHHGYPGQETTGPGGLAMALRNVPPTVEYGRLIERLSPGAWMINFTNPAGIITQAVSDLSYSRVIGICDTPTELFHRIGLATNAAPEEVSCEYVGLNHLGWVRKIQLRGEDVMPKLLNNDAALRSLYQADVFDPEMLRALRLIPTEYLFFYYCRTRALANQRIAGTTRGSELVTLNERLYGSLADVAKHSDDEAVDLYMSYLNQRSGSYMQLEASAGTAFDPKSALTENPFQVATGYHRIALDVMSALCNEQPRKVVVNVCNRGTISDLDEADIVEATCVISRSGVQPEPCGRLPEEVRGMVLAMKAFERTAIEAAMSGSAETARKAILLHPAIGEWDPSGSLLRDLEHSPGFPPLRG